MFITFWGKKSAVFRRLPTRARWITDWAACGLSINTSRRRLRLGQGEIGLGRRGRGRLPSSQRRFQLLLELVERHVADGNDRGLLGPHVGS